MSDDKFEWTDPEDCVPDHLCQRCHDPVGESPHGTLCAHCYVMSGEERREAEFQRELAAHSWEAERRHTVEWLRSHNHELLGLCAEYIDEGHHVPRGEG